MFTYLLIGKDDKDAICLEIDKFVYVCVLSLHGLVANYKRVISATMCVRASKG